MFFNVIAETEVDWDTYRELITQALGRSPFDQFHDLGIPINHDGRCFIGTLATIKNPKSNPVKYDLDVLKHLHYVAVIIDTKTTLFEIVSELNMAFTITPTSKPDYLLAVVSGTLQQWKMVKGPPALVEAIGKWMP